MEARPRIFSRQRSIGGLFPGTVLPAMGRERILIEQVFNGEHQGEDDGRYTEQVKYEFIDTQLEKDVNDKKKKHEPQKQVHPPVYLAAGFRADYRIYGRKKRCHDRHEENTATQPDIGIPKIGEDLGQ